MCGIVAAAAGSNIVPVLVEGLKKLEYRGYDSAGLAVIQGDHIERVRSVGRVAELEAASASTSAVTGIAHTRWATHGVPCERNAHPHISNSIAVVHNGIIENYESLRRELVAQGYVFTSDTDTESIAHLIDATLKSEPDLFAAVRIACRRLVGAYAIAVIDHRQPGKVVVAREGSPLLLGVSETGNYAASDASALLQVTRNMVYLENGDIAELTAASVRITRLDGTPVDRPVHVSQLSAAAVELGNYQHYMQKEIFEQPEALANTLEIVGGSKTIQPGIFGAEAATMLDDVDSILILACGTSSHSGYTARYWLEAIAGVPCTVEIASEYRYRTSVPNPRQLIVAISQSGETADTLAALRHAKSLGQGKTLAICNVPESAIVRECTLRFITRAGPEIGVASTKAFTTQLAALFVLTLVMAKVKQRLSAEQESAYIDQLRHLPVAVNKVLELESEIKVWAQRFADKHHALFLGRGRHFPIAMEGALKLKEISYIHAEAYPAGELKHGPLALVDANMPVISVAPNDQLLDKLKSNLREVQARGGELYVFADADSEIAESEGVHILRLPEHYGELSPILHVIPLQLLSYHAALVKGTDVDKPRNLAKSVTVE
ncbi:glutamine--fructose-6-phosphate transaminase (isomerizing) [Dechloromonas denitrificans]|uniref:glutamine--fructose-6-phosphate transaminase (isomerizing) n=1 Tax=Dechloromonas denitrificans TaxID=281362 RepID=UPI001CF92A07|nr:glutamine--fructose-6-phosphate transaminase (isomerizing) [Dechloromonas denitrificans]UCV03474.1 glutamine--fructose-6-phosphate transaminase (isomerizing) [Dechloromonas denitrificans]UCV07733.1 glutamine--fructose-6-phosphate transaminase (isomerizing) [Dechloromonas denitrificans]